MKKISIIGVALIMISTLLCGCLKVDSLSTENNELSVSVGETKAIEVSITPNTVTTEQLKWSSSNEKIADVDKIGTVTGVAEGECTITCSGGGKKIEINVTVVNEMTSTNYTTIDGVFLDDSYSNKDDESLRLLFVCYTVSTNDKNYEFFAEESSITIDDVNEYKSYHEAKVAKCMPNYSYSSSELYKVHKGDGLKIIETFQIPKAELDSSKISFSNDNIPEFNKLFINSQNVKVCENTEEIAKLIDPSGYEDYCMRMEDADEQTAQLIKSVITGYEYKISTTLGLSGNTNLFNFKFTFDENNNFYVETLATTVTGIYSIKKGYIICDVTNTDHVYQIPYTYDNGNVDLDTGWALDVDN